MSASARIHHPRSRRDMVADIVGYDGRIAWDSEQAGRDTSQGLDVSRIRATGWEASIPLRAGISDTYEWYLSNTTA